MMARGSLPSPLKAIEENQKIPCSLINPLPPKKKYDEKAPYLRPHFALHQHEQFSLCQPKRAHELDLVRILSVGLFQQDQ